MTSSTTSLRRSRLSEPAIARDDAQERVKRRVAPLDIALVAAAIGVAAALRAPALGQSTLWFDDAWAALAYKAEGVGELRLVALTSPGFAALLKGWFAAVGFSTTKAQVLPFLFGVAAPALVYVVLTRRGLSRAAAAAGAAVLALSHVHVVYSARGKQYTLEALVTVVLLAGFWWLTRDAGAARRWWAMAVVAIVAFVLATPSAVVTAVGFALAWLVALSRRTMTRHAVGATALVTVAGAAWWFGVVAGALNPKLHHFFAVRHLFIRTDEGLAVALGDAGNGILRVVSGAVSLPEAAAAALVAVALVVVLVSRPLLAGLFAGPVVVAIALAAFGLAPIGAWRTDMYLYPAVAMLLAAAIDEAGRRARLLDVGAAALLTAGLVAAIKPVHYPQEDLAPLVAEVEADASAGDAVLIYPYANFAVGLYTTWPVDVRASDRYATGFEVVVERRNVFSLPDRRDPHAYAADLDAITLGHDTLWLIGSNRFLRLPAIKQQLRERGYTPREARVRAGAELVRYSRG